LRTAQTEFASAARAKVEFGLHRASTPGAGGAQRKAQDEIEKDAQAIGNHEDHNGPKEPAHAAASCIAVDIADEQQITTHN
jgi:hypothetical protein